MGLFRKRLPLTKYLEITPPEPAAERSGIMIATMIKNEANYVAEWLRYHHAVGIRHFVLYDDGSTDGTREVIAETLPPKYVTIVPWRGRMIDAESKATVNSQAIAFTHAIYNFGYDYKRIAFIDTDEFLVPKNGKTVEEAIAGLDEFPNISLPWHMFGTSGHKTPPEGGVLMNYTRRARDPMSRKKNASNFKCIVDPCEVVEVSIHQFKTRKHGEFSANDVGHLASRNGRKGAGFYSAQNLQLNHYYTRSEAELEAKLSRGAASTASHQRYRNRVMSAVKNIEADTVEDRAVIDLIQREGIDLGIEPQSVRLRVVRQGA
ncbi:glycosyltransferase family 92 protein [Mycoplana ramosa]|uniref:Glycosyltransferase family 92 protein n=1 Tax=Mycoplana ramosa TaxID=40837 RepID=A0ABW3Z031_MYCRA